MAVRDRGFYFPVERDEDEIKAAVNKLGETVGQVLADSGLTEDEPADLVDLWERHTTG